MYKVNDYIHSGLLHINNTLRPRHKVLSSLMLYSTTRCQSRCKHCSIWQKPEEHLTLETITTIMRSKCVTSHTTVGLEGGEFVLHPECEEILAWFVDNHPNFTLLSNGLATKKVIECVRKYPPRHLYLSLDGDRECYRHMRGVDGHDKVIEIINALKGTVPISLMFCLSPWNGFKDMEYVIEVAKTFDVDIRIGIYGTMDFFDTNHEMLAAQRDYVSKIPSNIHETSENYDFVALYDEWKRGHLRLRCHSIFSELVIHSNGDVPLCQNLGVILGNVHNQSLDEIFNSRETKDVQCRYSHDCNGCWINYHRKYDVILLRNLEKVLPKRLIETIYGKYQWTANPGDRYKDFVICVTIK